MNASAFTKPFKLSAPFLFLSLLVALFIASPSIASADPAAISAPAERPSLAGFELEDLKGNTYSVAELKGKVIVISFWATWCEPCLQELPHMNGFYETYKDKGLVVLAISNDSPQTAAAVRRTAKRKRWTMPVLHDKESVVSALLNPRGTNPFTLVIDRQGRIAYSHEGYAPGDEKKYEEIIQKLLAEAAP